MRRHGLLRAAKKQCRLFVPYRPYGEPGPCTNPRDIKPIRFRDAKILACISHRMMIENGKKPEVAK